MNNKALYIWNGLLSLLVIFLLFKAFGKNDAGKQLHATNKEESKSFKIAYFEMDSIENSFAMVKDVKREIEQKENAYNRGVMELENTYKRKLMEYQQKGATMTEADMQQAQADVKKLEETLKNRKILLDQDYQDFGVRKNLAVKKVIEDFIAKYNKDKNYSYIVSYEPGLFYYKDTMYNITPDVIKGLNESYKATKK